MAKPLLSKEESKTLAEDVLYHCYGSRGAINQDMIERVSSAITSSLEKIVNERSKPKNTFPYKISEERLREIFEEQHKGRDLSKHQLRGTYLKAQIAALWNQHLKTARLIEQLLLEKTDR